MGDLGRVITERHGVPLARVSAQVTVLVHSIVGSDARKQVRARRGALYARL